MEATCAARLIGRLDCLFHRHAPVRTSIARIHLRPFGGMCAPKHLHMATLLSRLPVSCSVICHYANGPPAVPCRDRQRIEPSRPQMRVNKHKIDINSADLANEGLAPLSRRAKFQRFWISLSSNSGFRKSSRKVHFSLRQCRDSLSDDLPYSNRTIDRPLPRQTRTPSLN